MFYYILTNTISKIGGEIMYLAHIRESTEGIVNQTAREHSRNTARYAAEALRPVGLEQAGTLMGLVHDCGKFKNEFLQYLQDPNGIRGSVNHTFAGCRFLLEQYHSQAEDPLQKLSAELLALAVGSHHGLFDCVGEDRQSGFTHRMTKKEIGYHESIRNFLSECTSKAELDDLFRHASEELAAVLERIAGKDGQEVYFRTSLLARLLLSALIEADRRDTAEFMCNLPPKSEPEDLHAFWTRYLHRVEEKLDRFPADTPICLARREISDRCRAYAENPGGIYRLNIPTGGGKTLSSLRYALAHAEKWGKQRLIFTSPLLSILEQNAAVLRSFLDDDSIILEHHSNVIRTEEGGELDHRELAVESWDAPVIITTLVQLLNTLFDGKTTAIRRFQGLCHSVIVIDEVQTVPPNMLSLFNLATDFLVKVCGATVVLCSATQPCLEHTAHPLPHPVADMIPYDKTLWEPFRRTRITDAGTMTLEEIAAFAAEKLEETQSLLVVCNRKDEAEFLFRRLRHQGDYSCHLSASMCTAHRRRTLDTLRGALDHNRKCLCIATQVIEAGVDISFGCVIRLTAGMDSVIQAAGRCNRHGELAQAAAVYVVTCLGEKLSNLRQIREGKQATESVLYAYGADPGRFGCDLSSDIAIEAYYRKLYQSMPEGYQDFHIGKLGTTLFDLMSCNTKFAGEAAPHYFLRCALKTAGSAFTVFDSDTRDVIVPYGEGLQLIAELTGNDLDLRTWQQRAKAYSIGVYDWQLKKLGNAVTEHHGIAVLAHGFYDEDTGLVLQSQDAGFLEV